MRRLAVAGLAMWFIALAIIYQPHHNTPPAITHARLLEPPNEDLPTLPPLTVGRPTAGPRRG